MSKNVYIHVLLLIIVYSSCHKKPSKNIHQKLDAYHMGHWVNKDALKMASMLDSTDIIVSNSNQLLPSSFTEIDLDNTFFDSVFINKATSESYYLTMLSFTSNHLLLSDSSEIIFMIEESMMHYVLPNKYDTIKFFKAPEHLKKKPSESNQLYTFRFMLNAALNPYSYILVDSAHTLDDHNYVNFFANEVVRGYYDFTNYHIEFSSKADAMKDAVLISLSNKDNTKDLGFVYYADSVEIFDVQKRNEKSYLRDKKVGTLLKHKWEQ
jgi:hypothetical protein